MNLNLKLLLLVAACVPGGWWIWSVRGSADAPAATEHVHVVQRGRFQTWTPFEGTLEAVRREPVFSTIGEPTTLDYLVPEGTRVKVGDVLVRFDSSNLMRNSVSLKRDVALAESELNSLVLAEIPAQLESARNEVAVLRSELTEVERSGAKMAELAADGLLSDRQIREVERRKLRLEQSLAAAEKHLSRLIEVRHPANRQAAEANLEAARQQLQFVEEQIQNSEIRATLSGMVVYLPLHLDGEFRTAREGDLLYRNQRFLEVADFDQLIVRCQVPESRISLVSIDCPAVVVPRSYPNLQLNGRVQTVGGVAMRVQGRSANEKVFRVSLQLDQTDERLRSSMSVHAQILSHDEEDVVVVPRRYVHWQRNEPYVWMQNRHQRPEQRMIQISAGNEADFLVTDGLSPGEVLVVPEDG